jgi:hypothetical protein
MLLWSALVVSSGIGWHGVSPARDLLLTMPIPGRDATAMLVRAGFVLVLVPVNDSGFRSILARCWHGQTHSLTPGI